MSSSQEIRLLSEKIQEAQKEVTRAETICEGIEEEWEKNYGTRDVEEIAKKVKVMEKDVTRLSNELEDLLHQANVAVEKAGL